MVTGNCFEHQRRSEVVISGANPNKLFIPLYKFGNSSNFFNDATSHKDLLFYQASFITDLLYFLTVDGATCYFFSPSLHDSNDGVHHLVAFEANSHSSLSFICTFILHKSPPGLAIRLILKRLLVCPPCLAAPAFLHLLVSAHFHRLTFLPCKNASFFWMGTK